MIFLNEEYLDMYQIASILHVGSATVHRYIKKGRLPAYELKGKIWIKKSDLPLALKKVKTRDDC